MENRINAIANAAGRVKNRWMLLAERLHIPEVEALAIYRVLAEHYGALNRYYHGFPHIADLLDEVALMMGHVENPDALQVSVIYHDVILDPRLKNNEEMSARFALEMLSSADVDEDFKDAVSRQILVTKHRHDEVPTDTDMQIIAGIDLAIFGQSEEKFDEYEEQIAKEYSWVPPSDFRIGRREVLQGFLARPAIYYHPALRARYEVPARKNLARSVAKLAE